MFEGVVAGVLNRLLGKYIQDLDTENLNVGIFSGNVNLTDLKLKPEALYELDLPVDVKIGTIGRINLQIPWSGLSSQPVVASVEDVLLLVGPAISNTYFDPEREKRLMRAAKRKILQDLEAESEILTGPRNFFEQLFTAVINNVQIFIRNIHIRYEDSISSRDGPLACGLCLQSLSIETTNSKWKPAVRTTNTAPVYEAVRVESLSLYWNPAATVLDDAETANITPIQYYNWKHYMITGLDKFSMHHEDFEFLLKPVSCKVKVIISRAGDVRAPRLLVDAVLMDSALQMSRRQYLSIANLMHSFQRIKLNRKYRHMHPEASVISNAKKWWRYAFNVVVEQRVRPYTWQAIKTHRENYHKYKQTYKSTLRSLNDTELKLDLQQCEDSLPIISVVIAREHAKIELSNDEPERIVVVESEIDWWKAPSSDESIRARLCVGGPRTKTLWSHLSSPEKKKLYELIGYAEGAPHRDKPKQYIAKCTRGRPSATWLTMIDKGLKEAHLDKDIALNCAEWKKRTKKADPKNKEVLVVTLTQFLASIETRPSAKAYKFSARAESVTVEGLNAENDLVPLLMAERSKTPSNTTVYFLSLDYEKNPLNSEADYGLNCTVEPSEIIYNEHSCTEIINFFQMHSMSDDELLVEIVDGLERANRLSKSVLVYAISRKKIFNLNVDLKGPCIILPEFGCIQKSGKVLVLDVGRVLVKSDLQPANLALEDATCMELEEKLYDRIHAEFLCQILFCDSGEPWRDGKKHADSPLHLIPKIKTQIVFSNSIKKDYKLLPRYKLNISISSIKLNVSDRIISSLMEFLESVPPPRPNAVPVSYLDSADYPEEMAAPGALRLDAVQPDPSYRQLVELTHVIVAAHLCRRQCESAHDTARAPTAPRTTAAGAAATAGAAAEPGDDDAELFARSVDLPGFDDNVSPSNTIHVLLRFVIGELVINLSRSLDQTERPYIMVSVGKACLDVALMAFGPAVQLSVRSLLLADKQQHSDTGQYLEMIASDPQTEILNLIYRKVRADCPEFVSHFHSVEQALVADVGGVALVLHADATRTLTKYLQYIADKIQKRHVVNVQEFVIPKSRSLWRHLVSSYDDPPVPPGATKFSYSIRMSAVSLRLCQSWGEGALLEARLAGLESDCVFRANDRMIMRLFLNALHVDDLSEMTLYPKLVWLEEDKVLEIKYVRHAPRLYAQQVAAGAAHLKADGSLRLCIGKLHVVLLYKILADLQVSAKAVVLWTRRRPLATSGRALSSEVERHERTDRNRRYGWSAAVFGASGIGVDERRTSGSRMADEAAGGASDAQPHAPGVGRGHTRAGTAAPTEAILTQSSLI
ncbi:Vacuolar protein sorting-associated protein 13C [Eumeta japonica]|uniref:Vacuolar protein sorting-associated protein 13C n=1 Tax=Eumeta variegata TaxID=151549 RepID=A0A4C1VP88_EUMVA|nr:Vacuolar protein sorting-associated protein 13C [Eumeta japonica]